VEFLEFWARLWAHSGQTGHEQQEMARAVYEEAKHRIESAEREREVERYKALAAAMPVHRPLVEIGRRATPCGECHLQPGERCDICGALQGT
jgi:hypothetical protein